MMDNSTKINGAGVEFEAKTCPEAYLQQENAELQRTLTATQAQVSELREVLKEQYEADAALYAAPNDIEERDYALLLERHDKSHAALKQLIAPTADNEQAVKKIKAQALREAADEMGKGIADRWPEDFLRELADELDGGV